MSQNNAFALFILACTVVGFCVLLFGGDWLIRRLEQKQQKTERQQ